MDRDDEGRPGPGAKFLLFIIVVVALATLTIAVYLINDAPAAVRGSAGPLQQNSPGHDPPSSAMR